MVVLGLDIIMKVAIVGIGWIGRKMKEELMSRGHKVFTISHDGWISQICGIKFDYIINCAGHTGYPNVDSCELSKNTTYLANTVLPIQIYDYCQDFNIKFAHFSSGCIYKGNIKSIYAEPNFFGSTYSISKGISDNFLKWRCLLFRIRMPFSGRHEYKNFLSKIYRYSKEGKLFDGGQNSLTNVDEAVTIACDLIEKDAFGPFNLVNQGSLNLHQIVNMMDLKNVKWYNEEEFKSNIKCSRSNCVIPSYEKMSRIENSLFKAIQQWQISYEQENI